MITIADLRAEAKRLGWNDTQLLNCLQKHGVVSDNCIVLEDIAARDIAKAVEWLTSPPSTAPSATPPP